MGATGTRCCSKSAPTHGSTSPYAPGAMPATLALCLFFTCIYPKSPAGNSSDGAGESIKLGQLEAMSMYLTARGRRITVPKVLPRVLTRIAALRAWGGSWVNSREIISSSTSGRCT